MSDPSDFNDTQLGKTNTYYGTFVSLSADIVGGTVIASANDIAIRANNKVITPFSLYAVLESVGGGGLYPTTSTFERIVTAKIDILDDVLESYVGGTGISEYNFGDLLVGNAETALSTFPIGSDEQILTIDFAEPLGLKWKTITIEKIEPSTQLQVEEGYDSATFITPQSLRSALSNAPFLKSNEGIFEKVTITGSIEGIFVTTPEQAIDVNIENLAISPYWLEHIFSNPPPLGDNEPNTGSFTSLNTEYLQVDNPPWPTIENTFAENEVAQAKNATDVSLTPANIPTIMSDPGPIGTEDTYYNARFDNVKCSTLNITGTPPWPTLDVMFADNTEAVDKADGNKALTPLNIPAIMAEPGDIGTLSQFYGGFNELVCNSLVVNGDPPWPTLESNFATDAEAVYPAITTKALTPSNVPIIMANPGPIGTDYAYDAAFNNVSAASLTLTTPIDTISGGTGRSSYNTGDILVGGSANVLTTLSSGEDNQVLISDSGSSVGVKWTSLGGNVPAATTASYGTVKLASTKAIDDYYNEINMSTGALAISINTISNVLVSGNAYGNQFATANFASVTSDILTLTSPLPSTGGGTGYSNYNEGDLLMGDNFGNLKVLQPGGDGYVLRVEDGVPMWSPSESMGYASTDDYGAVQLASDVDVIAKTSKTKAITPFSLLALLASPGTIGGTSPASATFNEVSVIGALSLDAKIVIPVKNGGTGIGLYSAGEIVYGSSTGDLKKLPVGTYGQALMVSHNNELEWSNTGGAEVATTTQSGVIQLATDAEAVDMSETDKAVTPSSLLAVFADPPNFGNEGTPRTGIFSDLTVTGDLILSNKVMSTAEGGTGFYSVGKGDILVGGSDSTFKLLSTVQNNFILRSNSAAASGVEWSETPFPYLYEKIATPQMDVNDTTFVIPYCYVRNIKDTKNISINTSRIIDILTVGVTGNGITTGVMQSSALPGTVACNDIYVTGTSTAFTTAFIIGDVITIAGRGSRRIQGITDDTNLTVESPFNSDTSSAQYYHGGAAPRTNYYLYAGSSESQQYLFMDPRSMIMDGLTPKVFPPGVTANDIRQTRYVFYLNDSVRLHKMIWNINRVVLCPYISLPTDGIFDGAIPYELWMIPNTATTAEIRVRLTTTDPAGARFYAGDYMGTYFNEHCILDGPGTVTEVIKVPANYEQTFQCYVSDLNATITMDLIGYWVYDSTDVPMA